MHAPSSTNALLEAFVFAAHAAKLQSWVG